MLKTKNIYLYYFSLLVLFLLLSTVGGIPTVLRFVYLALVFVPVCIRPNLFPACLVCFFTMGMYEPTQTIMPNRLFIYLFLTILIVLLSRFNLKKIKRQSLLFIGVALYVCGVNVFNGGEVPDLVYCLLILSVFPYFQTARKQNIEILIDSFSVTSLFLSMMYFMNYNKYLSEFSSEFERSGWSDPNYLSCILGIGIILAFSKLVMKKDLSIVDKCFSILTIILSFVSQLLMASRGGFIATVVCVGILLIFSKVNVKYKIFALLLSILFCAFLYQKNFFDLLQYRFASDDGTGSGRLDIWLLKINSYFNSNLLQVIFGTGLDHGYTLGTIQTGTYHFVAFHNDFLALLCEYGLLGFIGIILLFVKLFFNCISHNKFFCSILLLYISLCMMTLEPLAAGRLTYWIFLYLILSISKSREKILN